MKLFKEKYESAVKALMTLEEALNSDYTIYSFFTS
jgi:hypothetical protein